MTGKDEKEGSGDRTDVVVVRCTSCGDTFALHSGDQVRCPSCGGNSAETAHEPLL